MGHQVSEDSESRFATYVEGLTRVIGHADRAVPLKDYCVGLLAAEGRKSVEPMAAVTAQPRPAFYYTTEAQQTRYRCDHCGDFNDIRGKYGYCASCAIPESEVYRTA